MAETVWVNVKDFFTSITSKPSLYFYNKQNQVYLNALLEIFSPYGKLLALYKTKNISVRKRIVVSMSMGVATNY